MGFTEFGADVKAVVESVRKIKTDFDAVVMKHTGHYPMLERPDAFNRHVTDVVQELRRSTEGP